MPGVKFLKREGIFLNMIARTALGLTQPQSNEYCKLPEVKRLEYEADHSCPHRGGV
jgi:hypothetical protein